MIRNYETMFVLKPTLSPEESAARIDGFKELLTKNGAEIEAVENIGIKPLAYEVQKNKRGYFYVIYFKADSSVVTELERVYTITEDVIKFLIVKFESKKEILNWQYMADRANGKATQRPGFKKPKVAKPRGETQDKVEGETRESKELRAPIEEAEAKAVSE